MSGLKLCEFKKVAKVADFLNFRNLNTYGCPGRGTPRERIKSIRPDSLMMIHHFYVLSKVYESADPFSLGLSDAPALGKVSAKAVYHPVLFVIHSCGKHQTMAPFP
jgi:hypothetical protein